MGRLKKGSAALFWSNRSPKGDLLPLIEALVANVMNFETSGPLLHAMSGSTLSQQRLMRGSQSDAMHDVTFFCAMVCAAVSQWIHC